tara:strand:+ start:459 stop:770 length:312 start_codon:yes stop_codon:yes gene_type:complete
MNTIKSQFENMLDRGIMPIFELEIIGDEYLLVNLSVSDIGVEFSFDAEGLRTEFDFNIKKIHSNKFVLLFDEYYDDLDSYLELIHENLMEGFIIPNQLHSEEW